MEASSDNGKTFSGTVNKGLIFDVSVFFSSEFSFSRLLNYFFRHSQFLINMIVDIDCSIVIGRFLV